MADRLDFLTGVSKLHAFYTEQVRMLAHAYSLSDEDAATLLDGYGYHNVARAILYPPKVEVTPSDAQEAEGNK
ncbi:hypothetical protein GCM10009785_20900 [Brooklawnia cerclae]|uniref:Uncharacterized protein n=1 Tax=Brooklawnia cerclae TaxID=349934 RepID=A0ABX0SN36_9ACTN|nr:hypothetical protein [Brooklawnia cerclae]NIH58181.1 hypothetical protein [Brooklawnia cerclae]